MLKTRLLTAAVLIPVILFAIFKLPSLGFLLLLLLITMMATWEWLAVIKIKPVWFRALALLLTLLITIATLLLFTESLVLWVAAGFWIVLSLFVAAFAHCPLPVGLAILFKNRLFGWLLATITMALFVYSALFIHGIADVGPQWAFFFLVTVWLTDTGGYFAGKRWGKTSLASHISPNKTVAGLVGGLMLALAWGLLAYSLGMNQQINFIYWVALTLLTALVSVVGDLFESLFKRAHQVKDSGQVLPGHGGMLDRVDSVLAGAPIFAAGLWLQGF